MKTRIVLTLVIAFFYSTSHSQCTFAIPPNAVVINAIDTINGGFDPLWVCPGDSLHTDGGLHSIYLEPGSLMTTGGGIDTIFVKKNATLFMNGGIHYIYYEDSSDLHLAGGIPTLDSCFAVSFNYAIAPVNGCFTGPVAAFQASDSSVCVGSCINFTDLSINATSWHWSFPGAMTPTDTVQDPQNICYSLAGIYDVQLIISDSISSDTLVIPGLIVVNPKPAVTGLQNGNILSVTSNFAGYQWYADTVLLIGETNDTLLASVIATYSVIVTDTNGCDTTLRFIYDNTGIVESKNSVYPFIIMPNPVKDFFEISFLSGTSSMLGHRSDLEIINAFGSKVLTQNLDFRNKTRVQLKNISPGIYFVKVPIGNKIFFRKLIVNH